MKKIKNKKKLEILIQSIPTHPNPKVQFEQYSTPASIAADLVWNAYNLGDILDKDVVDLGCGCGIFAIASKLLGANNVCGIDIDQESLELANVSASALNIEDIDFYEDDVFVLSRDFSADTVFQNPPFGSQEKVERGSDVKFIDSAIGLNPEVIYSFHMASTEEFIIDYFLERDFKPTHCFRYKFPIPKIYDFHTKESKNVDIIVLRAVNLNF